MPGTSTYNRKPTPRGACGSCHQQRLLQSGLCTTCIAERYRDLDGHCYLDRDDFRDYAAAVELVIFRARDAWVEEHGTAVPFPGLGTRAIHDALGDRAQRGWTMNALTNNGALRLVEGLIDRWRPADGHAPKFKGRWNRDSMNFLFPQRKRAARADRAETRPSGSVAQQPQPSDPPRERAPIQETI